MKILLVNPPVIRFEKCNPRFDQRFNSFLLQLKLRFHENPKIWSFLDEMDIGKGLRFGLRAGSRWPWTIDMPLPALAFPFFLAYTASYLKSNGYSVEIMDAVADQEYNYTRFLKNVKKKNADIVLIECSTPTLDIDIWMAEKISQFSKVALAGPHLAIKSQEMSDKYPFVSFFLKGEYILSSLEMVVTQKEGIYEPKIVEDLDSIPFPFRDFPAATKYFEPTMPTPRPQLQIYGSKGCPFKCSFCMWPQTMYNRKVSLRSPEKIALEIRECITKYGYKSILFDDDTFNLGTERISTLCEELKKIGLPWTMMGRLDCSPNWLFDKMVASGCVGMRFGVETFNLDVLKSIHKGIERIDFQSTLKYLATSYPDLMLHLTMMKNLPGQTEEIHQNDMKILKDLGFDNNDIKRSYQLSSCVPFPGTDLYYELKERNNGNLDNFIEYDGFLDTVMTRIEYD